MNEPDLEILIASSLIQKKCKEIKWKCLSPLCTEYSINSHLLQRNGILNVLAENGHFIEIIPNDLFKIEKEGLMDFKKVGIDNTYTLAQPLFCNKHDSETFQTIEKHPIDFSLYKTQLLFSYRAFCGELRKKQNLLELHKNILQSEIIQMRCSQDYTNTTKSVIAETQKAIEDLQLMKSHFEDEIANNLNSNFIFYTFSYDIIKVSISAAFNPIQDNKGEIFEALHNGIPLKTVFINVIPQEDKLNVIVGYHKNYCNDWIIEYVKSWKDLDKIGLQNNLTDLIGAKVETWCMAISLFETIKTPNKEALKKYWNENMTNFSIEQKVTFNFFES